MSKQEEGYGLGIEGDGYAKPIKPIVTAWAVEVDGKIAPCNIFSTRKFARMERNDYEYDFGKSCKPHVRRVQIVPVKGR